MSKDRVKIIVAAHKKYRMPDDPMYLPLHVGAEGKETDLGYTKDDTGDNISNLNESFCELTGLYWAWKNLDADYIGLVHYRRHFGFSKTKDPYDGILTYAELEPLLEKVKIFVTNKRRYYIETLYSHYVHTHYAEQLDETEKIINRRYPEYLESYKRVIKQRYGYMFNMMIMERNLLCKYCEWLFDILFMLQKRMDSTELSAFQGRFYGRVSEIIFNVWLDYQMQTGIVKNDNIMEIPCIHMEKIDWKKKGTAFMKAKLFNIKYEDSNFSKPQIRRGGVIPNLKFNNFYDKNTHKYNNNVIFHMEVAA